MKIIAIDAIDVKSLGGLVHLEKISKTLIKKKIFLKIYSNSFIKKNLKKHNKIELINKSLFDYNYFLRHLWKTIFFKRELLKNKCEVLLSLNGIYHGFFKPTILLQQNALPFDILEIKKNNYSFKFKCFLQKVSVLISIIIHRNVIFTSRDLKNKIIKNFNQKKLNINSVIYHGVNHLNFKKKIYKKKKIKLIYVSEFQKYKNHDLLFEALQRNINKNIYIYCLGRFEKDYLNELKSKYNFKKLNINIIRDTSHNKVLKKLKYYDGIIFPSLCESFGLPLLEAAASKLPIICSNLKVFKEIYGNGCIYFNPKNPISISNKINYFYHLNKKEIIKKVRTNYLMSKKLNWQFCSSNYYKTILNTKKLYEKQN